MVWVGLCGESQAVSTQGSLALSKVDIKPDWRIGSIKGCSHESKIGISNTFKCIEHKSMT